MPREIADIKTFLQIARRQDARVARIKESTSRKGGAPVKATKFKIRCSKYLYTLSLQDQAKASKLRESLPPGLKVEKVDDKPKKK